LTCAYNSNTIIIIIIILFMFNIILYSIFLCTYIILLYRREIQVTILYYIYIYINIIRRYTSWTLLAHMCTLSYFDVHVIMLLYWHRRLVLYSAGGRLYNKTTYTHSYNNYVLYNTILQWIVTFRFNIKLSFRRKLVHQSRFVPS